MSDAYWSTLSTVMNRELCLLRSWVGLLGGAGLSRESVTYNMQIGELVEMFGRTCSRFSDFGIALLRH